MGDPLPSRYLVVARTVLNPVNRCAGNSFVPRISAFYGIVIYMYYFDDERHKLPHIHAAHQQQEAVFSIPDGTVLAGSISPTKAKLVTAWIEIHKGELMSNWNRAVDGLVPYSIDALR